MEEIKEFENNEDLKLNDDFYKIHYGMIKRLKGIENGFVILFFIFTIIFLAAEIFYLYFTCGIGEYQLLKDKAYKVLNILKIIIFIFSLILAPLSICFTVMVQIAYNQYLDFIVYLDLCSVRMLMDVYLGYYSFFFI